MVSTVPVACYSFHFRYTKKILSSEYLPTEMKRHSGPEPHHIWSLKQKFKEANKGKFSPLQLMALTEAFGNVEFYGCTYPAETMKQVN